MSHQNPSSFPNHRDFKKPKFTSTPAKYLWYQARRLTWEAVRACCVTAVHAFVKLEEYGSLVFPEYKLFSGISLAKNLHATNHRLHAMVGGEEPFDTHPVVSVLGCLDGGIDYKRALGWMPNGLIDVTRFAGSAFSPGVVENLAFLSARHPVRLHIVTRHSNCAAEALACNPEEARLFPHIWSGVAEREHYFRAFLCQPEILEQLHPGVARRFLETLTAEGRAELGVTPAREQVIRDRSEFNVDGELVILPMVVDKRKKLFFVDTHSVLYPILLAVYPVEVKAMVAADIRVACRHRINLEELLTVPVFSQPESCACGSGRQFRRTKCVMLAGVAPRPSHSANPVAHFTSPPAA